MNAAELEQLRKNVMAHQFRQQETYQINGVRYIINKGNAASTERWTLEVYPEDAWGNFISGDTIEEVFQKATEEGVPVDLLTFEEWHS